MKVFKRGILTAVVALLALSAGTRAAAQNTSAAYGFLDVPTSAHVVGLGGNNIALIDEDVSLSDQNPALIGPELDKQMEVNYMLYMAQGNFAGFRYGMGVGDHSAWAAGIRYMDYGFFDGYDENGVATGKFKPTDFIIEGTYSRDITSRWRGGVNLKVAYSGYEDYSAWAMAADLGVNYYDPEKDLSFSVVLRNMGGQIKRFGGRYSRLPFDIQLGYMQSIGNSPFQVSITANNLTKWSIPYYSYNNGAEGEVIVKKSGFFRNLFRHLIFGVQYEAAGKFYAALAYNYKTATDMSSFNHSFLSGFSLGVGFKVKYFRADVAYAIPHKKGSTLAVNLSYTLTGVVERAARGQ
ncbi:MAG: type IX secretion system protein PorQ [Bacteroidales bacterium]|nr:type IX secretion system protein PorQ [Bacteroidales bacterium]